MRQQVREAPMFHCGVLEASLPPQANYSRALENHCEEGEAKREEMRRGKNFSLPPACQACFKLRATAALKSTDRIKFDFGTAVARCLKKASPFSWVAVSLRALTYFTHSTIPAGK